jgi:hypothetical protein
VFRESQCDILGTDGDDRLIGTPQPDAICGEAGDDTIRGGDGADTVLGGPGHDDISGGAGTDCLVVDDPNELRDDPDAPPGDHIVPQEPGSGQRVHLQGGQCSVDRGIRGGPPTPGDGDGDEHGGNTGGAPSPTPGEPPPAPAEAPVQAGSLYLTLTRLLAEGDQSEPRANVTARTARLRGRTVTLLLVCTGSSSGTVELVLHRARGRERTVLGSERFECAGETSVASLKLSQRHAELLDGLHDVRLLATMNFRDSSGERRETRSRLALAE